MPTKGKGAWSRRKQTRQSWKVGGWAEDERRDVHEEVKEEGSSNNNAMFADWVIKILSINE